jgi:hypothetical protein
VASLQLRTKDNSTMSLRTFVVALSAAIAAQVAVAQSSITPLTTFGTNGWLMPGSSAYLGSGHFERGLAYNPVTGNLVLVSRAGGNHVRVLDGTTGADLGGLLTTGMSGGTYVLNMAGVADDGAIYVGNLTTSLAAVFKVYKWDSEAWGLGNAPSVAYSGSPGVTRLGDSFAVHGGVLSPAIFATGGSNNVSASNFAVGALDTSNVATAYTSVAGTTTTSNDYRLGMAFVDADTVIGNQGANARLTSFNGATATLDATVPVGTLQRPLDYAVINGTPVLAVVDTATSMVTVYDLTVPSSPAVLTSGTAVSGTLVANGNATGSVQWGPITGNTAVLYAMSTNQGIQAFTVTIDPPARSVAFGIGCGSPALALSSVGAPLLPSTMQLQVDNIPVTVVAGFYMFGFQEIPGGASLPFAPGCFQYLVPLSTSFFFPAGAPSYSMPQNWPNDPGFAGVDVFAQAGTFDLSSAILATNGLRLHLNVF